MSTHNVHEVLKAIEAASEAYDLVPSLRRRIDDLEQALASEKREHDQLAERYADTENKLSTTQDKLRSVEAERDRYGFRNLELEEQIGTVRKLLGQDTTTAGSQDEQKSEPVVTEGKLNPTPSDTDLMLADTSTPAPATGVAAIASVGQSDLHPTLSTGASEGSGTSGTANTTTAVKPNDADTSEPMPVPVNPRPYEGQGYWLKPASMPWSEWQSKGGYRPGWAVDDNTV